MNTDNNSSIGEGTDLDEAYKDYYFPSDDEGSDLDEAWLQYFKRKEFKLPDSNDLQSPPGIQVGKAPKKKTPQELSATASTSRPSTSDAQQKKRSRSSHAATLSFESDNTPPDTFSDDPDYAPSPVKKRKAKKFQKKTQEAEASTSGVNQRKTKKNQKQTQEAEASTSGVNQRKKRTQPSNDGDNTSALETDAETRPRKKNQKKAGTQPNPRAKQTGKKTPRGGRRPAMNIEADYERINSLRERRKEKLKEDISNMSREEIEDLLFRTLERRPGMIFDILAPQPAPPLEPEPREEQPEWCSCGNCIQMPTDAECLCCRNTHEECTSSSPVFQLITDEASLMLQRAMWADAYNLEGEPQEPGEDNKAMRHAGYRSFIFWQHGRLGQGNRRVVPSCCVTTIRRLYPSINGQYTGYVPGRFV